MTNSNPVWDRFQSQLAWLPESPRPNHERQNPEESTVQFILHRAVQSANGSERPIENLKGKSSGKVQVIVRQSNKIEALTEQGFVSKLEQDTGSSHKTDFTLTVALELPFKQIEQLQSRLASEPAPTLENLFREKVRESTRAIENLKTALTLGRGFSHAHANLFKVPLLSLIDSRLQNLRTSAFKIKTQDSWASVDDLDREIYSEPSVLRLIQAKNSVLRQIARDPEQFLVALDHHLGMGYKAGGSSRNSAAHFLHLMIQYRDHHCLSLLNENLLLRPEVMTLFCINIEKSLDAIAAAMSDPQRVGVELPEAKFARGSSLHERLNHPKSDYNLSDRTGSGSDHTDQAGALQPNSPQSLVLPSAFQSLQPKIKMKARHFAEIALMSDRIAQTILRSRSHSGFELVIWDYLNHRLPGAKGPQHFIRVEPHLFRFSIPESLLAKLLRIHFVLEKSESKSTPISGKPKRPSLIKQLFDCIEPRVVALKFLLDSFTQVSDQLGATIQPSSASVELNYTGSPAAFEASNACLAAIH